MLPALPHKIFLTGFMASGKSSVARHLARLLKRSCVDIDKQIVMSEGCTINEIFAQKGENYFRDCETDFLCSLNDEDVAVYATGGGIVLREQNRQMMHQLGMVIYLRSTWQTLQQRLIHSKERPLIKHEQGWAEIKKMYQERQVYYLDADMVFRSDQASPYDVATSIYNKLLEDNLE